MSMEGLGFSAAAARPGVDPRVWLEIAQVGDDQAVDGSGHYVECLTLTDKAAFTAMKGALFTTPDGSGGSNFKLHPRSLVLVAHPAESVGLPPVIVACLYSASTPPPEELESEPGEVSDDPFIRVEAGKTLRVLAKDGASVLLKAEGSGTINILSEQKVTVRGSSVDIGLEASRPVAHVGSKVKGYIYAIAPTGGGPLTPGAPGVGGIPFEGLIDTGRDTVLV